MKRPIIIEPREKENLPNVRGKEKSRAMDLKRVVIMLKNNQNTPYNTHLTRHIASITPKNAKSIVIKAVGRTPIEAVRNLKKVPL